MKLNPHVEADMCDLFEHRTMHRNSLRAYAEQADSFSARCKAIFNYLLEYGISTDREIMNGLMFTEPNAIRPRVTEMVKEHILEEIDTVICPVTKKHVRRVAIKPRFA